MEAKRELLKTGLSPSEEVSGSWLTEEQGNLVVNVGIRGATEADQARLENAATEYPELGADVRIVDVPHSLEELETFQDRLMSEAVSRGHPDLDRIRPDLGRLEVALQPETSESVEDDLSALVPECVAAVVSGDPIGYATYTRQDMPPVKAGKIIEMHAYETDPQCTTGSVFELDGSGEQPLRGG